jgi:hypothetical protein
MLKGGEGGGAEVKLRREPKKPASSRRKGLLLGLGFDAQDGHVRVTTGSNFRLLGGSEETHERMQEKAIRFNEELDKRGKRIEECSVEELHDIADRAKLGQP